MKLISRLPGLLLGLLLTARALPVAADTTGPYTLNYANLVAGPGAIPFTLPRFDPSLGALQSVDIAWDFSGTVAGTATGVSAAFPTITHSVFFGFTDLSDNVFIAEPTLWLTANIPPGAQNATISFGPQFQSTSYSFNVTEGDPRFDAWVNGPGEFSGSLDVYFTNITMDAWGLHFFSGADTGLYSGSLSIAYNYAPVPEPGTAGYVALFAIGAWLVRRHRQVNAA